MRFRTPGTNRRSHKAWGQLSRSTHTGRHTRYQKSGDFDVSKVALRKQVRNAFNILDGN